MKGDWKDALAALQGSLPRKTDEMVPQEAVPSVSDEKKSSRGKINIAYERKGRGGKSATIIYGFSETESDEEISDLATRLKQRLGTGGSTRGGEILLQGDVREKVKPLLRQEGYRI